MKRTRKPWSTKPKTVLTRLKRLEKKGSSISLVKLEKRLARLESLVG